MLRNLWAKYRETIIQELGTLVVLNLIGWVFAVLVILYVAEGAFGSKLYGAEQNIRDNYVMHIVTESSPENPYLYEISSGSEVLLKPTCGDYSENIPQIKFDHGNDLYEIWFPGCSETSETLLLAGNRFSDNGEIEAYELTSTDSFLITRQFVDPNPGRVKVGWAIIFFVAACAFFNISSIRDLDKTRKVKKKLLKRYD